MSFFSTGCYNIHNCFDYVNYLLIFAYRFAGTIGAIVTCPLEVVKTRLQSSSSPFYPSPILDVANKNSTNGAQFKGTSHKRDICTSILRKRSQVSPYFCMINLAYLILIHSVFTDSNHIPLWNIFQFTVH